MTQTNEAANGADPVVQPLLDFWSKYVEQSQEQMKVLLDGVSGVGDPAALRRLWLDSLSKSLESYLRTPAFLEGMRRNLEVMTHLKGNAEDIAQEVARNAGIPRLGDISGLFERLQIGQEAILARLTGIEHRLERLENRRKHTT